jgi:hypothetical protein
MGWVIFFGIVLVFGVLLWRREHKGTRGGFALRGERGADAAHQADMKLRNSTARGMSGYNGGGGPSF